MNGYLVDVCRALYCSYFNPYDIIMILWYYYGLDINHRTLCRALALETYPERELPDGYLSFLAESPPEWRIDMPSTDEIVEILAELYTSLPKSGHFCGLYSEGDYTFILSQTLCEAPISDSDLIDEAHGGHRELLGQEYQVWYPKDGKTGLQNYLKYEKDNNREQLRLPDWSNDERV